MHFAYVKDEERWKKEDWKHERKKKADKIEAMKEQWRNMRKDEKLKVESGITSETSKKKKRKCFWRRLRQNF